MLLNPTLTNPFRLFVRWKAALQILFLALVLTTPSLAMATCPSRERPTMDIAAVAASAADCHASIMDGAHPHNDKNKGMKDAAQKCCDMGMSCASATLQPASPDESLSLVGSGLVTAIAIKAYSSLIPSPDYPPPRA